MIVFAEFTLGAERFTRLDIDPFAKSKPDHRYEYCAKGEQS